ncbi:hypothetical protein IP91_00097 [Pseudoduganella lurida]|uniref:Uncharacterized protein n=1 Tax=Pseudoduganella lurida TaxID=1036180 RepID=A0A562RIW4_9BURK|nr:hypothetical protein [Pseudoduganella lurida]TWI69032.1 hypothetical protein IP91_00097 [Pseudoduganella lurida]
MEELYSIYPKWRLRLLHLFAKALGVLVHVRGCPFGSVRLYRRSPEGNPANRTGAGGSPNSITASSEPE